MSAYCPKSCQYIKQDILSSHKIPRYDCSKFGGHLDIKYMESKRFRFIRVPTCRNREFDDIDEDIYHERKESNGQEEPAA